MDSLPERIEAELRELVKGEFSSITLSWNDENGPNYRTVREDEEDGDTFGDWVSEGERQKAIRENSKWVLQWYPDTPVGFHAIAASSLSAIFTHLRAKEQPNEG